MSKCEHHDEFTKLLEVVEKNINGRVGVVEKRVDRLRDDVDEQGRDHRETEAYVKQLYKRFDELTIQITGLVAKLDQYIHNQTIIDHETKVNSDFVKRNKNILYEVMKYLVILVLGYAIAKGGGQDYESNT